MSVTTFTTVNGMILSQAKGGVVSHFVPDPLGSVVMVRDTSGNTVYEAEYDPYGNVQSETGTNPHRALAMWEPLATSKTLQRACMSELAICLTISEGG